MAELLWLIVFDNDAFVEGNAYSRYSLQPALNSIAWLETKKSLPQKPANYDSGAGILFQCDAFDHESVHLAPECKHTLLANLLIHLLISRAEHRITKKR